MNILIVIAFLTPSFLYPLFTYTQAHAITLLSALDQPHKLYRMYHIILHVMINGKSLPMILDTGDDITVVTGHFVKDLQLDKLPSSKILDKKVPMINVDNHTDYLKSVDVKMSIEGSPPFNTSILLDADNPAAPPPLCIHDLMKPYSGIQLRPEIKLIG